ncbi:MAG: polysaccharide deacetylase family protein [Bacteroidales bacterium]|nr:polysaccharide deacetylase family protein [Bacteroidales bacterium]
MTSSKNIFFRLCSPMAVVLPLSWLRKLSGKKLLIPVYHAVSEAPPSHLSYLYTVKSPKAFEADLEVMLAHYKPVSMQELIKMAEGGEPIQEPVFHLTFDDGLKEFYEVVAPILRKKGLTATCFLNNDFIDNKDMLFRMKVSLLIDHLHHSVAGSSAWVAFHDWVQKHHFGRIYYRKLLLGLGRQDLPKIEELAAELDIHFDQWLKTHTPYMTTKQIKELIDQGFTFGAHSRRHIDFRELDEDEQVKEVESSCSGISSDFGLGYRVFSFPFTDFGMKAVFFERLRNGKSCQLSFGCAGIKEDAVPTNLQRMPVEEYPANMANALKKEYLYYLFLRMVGKAKMKR